jgi:hypothetical protein
MDDAEKLAEAVKFYINERDNDKAPDYALRRIYYENMRRALYAFEGREQ